ncbi:MAG TPA: hypothetical protein VKZ94_11465 [Advenella sp.]|nr:hypothetical protein [Advenella sp.]
MTNEKRSKTKKFFVLSIKIAPQSPEQALPEFPIDGKQAAVLSYGSRRITVVTTAGCPQPDHVRLN